MSNSLILILNNCAARFFNRRQDGVVGKSLDSKVKLHRFKSQVCYLVPLAPRATFDPHYFHPQNGGKQKHQTQKTVKNK